MSIANLVFRCCGEYNVGMKYDYVGLGYCSNDHLCVLPHIPIDSKVQMSRHEVGGGGPSANSTVAAAKLGLAAAYIGTVGDDADGRMILDEFEREGVFTGAMKIRKGASSAIAYLWIEEKTGCRSCAWTREGLAELEADEIDLDIIRNAKIFHIDGHNPKGALAGVRAAKEAGVIVNFDAGTLRDGVPELLPYADILICSEEFALKLTGLADTEAAVRKIFSEYKPRVAGATAGIKGSMAFDGRSFVRCPAFEVAKVVDTTGCGDLFHTGFAVRYMETHDLMDCQRFGAAVASIKCAGLGGRTAAPSRSQVDAFLKKH